MKVKFIGETDPVYMINGKVYDVISIEETWYRIVDEEGGIICILLSFLKLLMKEGNGNVRV